jgi:hypothetical protein
MVKFCGDSSSTETRALVCGTRYEGSTPFYHTKLKEYKMDKRKLTKAQKEIEHEIEWYECSKDVTKIMRRLGKWGFEFSGHGAGFGGEDFSLIKYLSKGLEVYVNISDRGKFPKCYANIDDYNKNQDDPYEPDYEIKESKAEIFFPLLKKAIKKYAADA